MIEIAGLLIRLTAPSLATDFSFNGVPSFTSSRDFDSRRILVPGSNGLYPADRDSAEQDLRPRRHASGVAQVGLIGRQMTAPLLVADVVHRHTQQDRQTITNIPTLASVFTL